MLTVGVTPVEELYSRWTLQGARLAGSIFVSALYGGMAAAAFGWAPGIVVALVGALSMFLIHLVVGVTAYRETMRRRWPAVEPLDGEDD